MKKQSFIKLLTLFFLIIALSACEKPDEIPIAITKAELIIENGLPLIEGEELKVYITESAHRDQQTIKPEKYIWTIEDSLGTVINDDFNNQAGNIKWIAEDIGKYIISLTLDYGENVKKTIEQEIEVVSDFRLPYTGDYHFMKITRHWQEFREDRIDTTYYNGYVKPVANEKNMVEIKSGEEQLHSQGYHEHFSTELFYKDGYEHPQFGRRSDHKYRYGFFVNPDSIVIRIAQGALGGGANWNYYGSKVK